MGADSITTFECHLKTIHAPVLGPVDYQTIMSIQYKINTGATYIAKITTGAINYNYYAHMRNLSAIMYLLF